MLAAFPTKGNSMRLIARRIALWLTLLAVGQSSIGFALAACCSRPGGTSSCCAPSSRHLSSKPAHVDMRSIHCHDSTDDESAEASSAPCNMAASAGSPEFAEEARLARQEHSAVDPGLHFVSSMKSEGAFAGRMLWRDSVPLATRQRSPIDAPVPLRI